MTIRSRLGKMAKSIKQGKEQAARRTIIEDLFYDFNRSRSQVYVTNFVRGILFGAGSVIGGTVVIALLVWMLSLLGNFIPALGDFFDGVSQTLDVRDSK